MAKTKIPGASSKRIPGRANMPRMVGGFRTNVPRMGSAAAFGAAHRQQVRDAHGRFAGGWGFAILGLEAADDALYDYLERTKQNVSEAAERLAQEMEAWAKTNAPWTDRSTNARSGLWSKVVWTSDTKFSIMLGHGADIHYGIWLEVRYGGRYAIILPTLMQFAPQLGTQIRSMT